jgi:DMSO/TMAO reductase YedYZ molybdopterin-dependent catalytic subunit
MDGTRDELHVVGLVAGGDARFDRAASAGLAAPHQVADVGRAVRGRAGRAVTLQGLLERAPPLASARWLNVVSSDPAFAVSVPLTELAGALVVYAEPDGRALAQGGPFRLLVPGHPDECVNVKGVVRLELADRPGRDTRPRDDAEHAALHARAAAKRGETPR